MQKNAMATSASPEGFLLLDSARNPIFVNPVATQALVYPRKPEAAEEPQQLSGKQNTFDTFFAAVVDWSSSCPTISIGAPNLLVPQL